MRLPRLVASVSVVALVWMTVGAVAARAQEDDDSGRTGFYVGMAGIYGTRPFVVDEMESRALDAGGALAGAEAKTESVFGANVRLGYRVHPHLAAEVEAQWRHEAPVELIWGRTRAETLGIETWLVSANAKGYLFLGGIEPYVLLGGGAAIVDIEGAGLSSQETGFAVSFAGGADFHATEHFVINAELRWVLPAGDLDGFDEFSLLWGVQYHF